MTQCSLALTDHERPSRMRVPSRTIRRSRISRMEDLDAGGRVLRDLATKEEREFAGRRIPLHERPAKAPARSAQAAHGKADHGSASGGIRRRRGAALQGRKRDGAEGTAAEGDSW